MILRTDSRTTSLLCHFHPLLVSFEYHDPKHVKLSVDIDNVLSLFCLLCGAALVVILARYP